MGLRLGFYFHVPATSKNNDIYMPGYQGRFIDTLAYHCTQVVCFLHSPLDDELATMDYRIMSSNVRLVDIGPHLSVPRRIIKVRKLSVLLNRYAEELDILLLRGPSPLLPAMGAASPVPTVLLLVGDYMTGINDLHQPFWRREIIRLWAYWNKLHQNALVRKSLNFVNSRILFEELKALTPNLYETRTTTLTSNDFFVRSDTCQSTECRLLYVGRMDRAKGLLQMVEAVALLIALGEDVSLNLVGWTTPHDTILEEVEALARVHGISERINYLGPSTLGPELFDHYIKSDIFITASLASEGFPRTILEAMAHSLPVVATRVGSIPTYIEGAAELVAARNVGALADAIFHIIHQPDFRRQLIARGYELACNNTLDIQVGDMVRKIQSWVNVSS